MKQVLFSILKALACGIVFFVGTILGSVLAAALGIPAPEPPQGADQASLMIYLLLASLGIGALLAFLATRVSGGRLARWLTLAALGWVMYSLSTYIEASIFTTYGSASMYKVVMDLVAFLAASGLAVVLFPAAESGDHWLTTFSLGSISWRLAAAWIAFPIIYLTFGRIVEPLVIDVYRQGLYELNAPGWGEILLTQALRSQLFLLVCLGLIARWNGTRLALWGALTSALFLLIGGFYMLQAFWFPAGFRLIHSLEMLADALLYAACLTTLFAPAAAARQVSPARS